MKTSVLPLLCQTVQSLHLFSRFFFLLFFFSRKAVVVLSPGYYMPACPHSEQSEVTAWLLSARPTSTAGFLLIVAAHIWSDFWPSSCARVARGPNLCHRGAATSEAPRSLHREDFLFLFPQTGDRSTDLLALFGPIMSYDRPNMQLK